jgi:Phosphorylated CTD interacting factor 1 WW domain
MISWVDLVKKNRINDVRIVSDKYKMINYEINKIKALNIFKYRLIHNILKYFRYHKLYDKKCYIEHQLSNHFPNWFFQLNVKNFIPLTPFQIQENLDYIFGERKIEKRVDFDVRLLLFDVKYIKNITCIVSILKKVQINYVYYALNTNVGIYNLMPISIIQYDHLMRNYTGPNDRFDEYLCIILARYKFLGGLNNHLSVPPNVYKFMNINCELFGSPLNTVCNKYCSPFFEYEQYFGSLGSFFNYKLQTNMVYGVNPPFSANIITKMVQKIEYELTMVKNITLYIIIPKWDDNFDGFDILKKSKFSKTPECIELSKKMYPYYNYFKLQYVSVVDSLLIILSNADNFKTPTDIKNEWQHYQSTNSINDIDPFE